MARDGERAMAEYLCTYLNSHGIAATLQSIDDRHANVIGRIWGKSDQTVIWNGHLDTVLGKLDEWDTHPSLPIRLEAGHLRAGSQRHEKLGLAAMAYVCAKMAESCRSLMTRFFLGTCDEGRRRQESFFPSPGKSILPFLLIGGYRLEARPRPKKCLWLSNAKGSHGASGKGGNALEGGFPKCCEDGSSISISFLP